MGFVYQLALAALLGVGCSSPAEMHAPEPDLSMTSPPPDLSSAMMPQDMTMTTAEDLAMPACAGFSDDFAGGALDPCWKTLNGPEAIDPLVAVSVAGGALHLQAIN